MWPKATPLAFPATQRKIKEKPYIQIGIGLKSSKKRCIEVCNTFRHIFGWDLKLFQISVSALKLGFIMIIP